VLALRGLARSELIRLMSISRCNWYPRFDPEEASTTSSIRLHRATNSSYTAFPELPAIAPSVTEDRGVCAVRSG
jgi:hypothetical protein